jgi:hypothetical protein
VIDEPDINLAYVRGKSKMRLEGSTWMEKRAGGSRIMGALKYMGSSDLTWMRVR